MVDIESQKAEILRIVKDAFEQNDVRTEAIIKTELDSFFAELKENNPEDKEILEELNDDLVQTVDSVFAEHGSRATEADVREALKSALYGW